LAYRQKFSLPEGVLNHSVDKLWIYNEWSKLGGLKIWCLKTHYLK